MRLLTDSLKLVYWSGFQDGAIAAAVIICILLLVFRK